MESVMKLIILFICIVSFSAISEQWYENGNCVTEVDYRIVKPDGSVYTEIKNTELWKNKPAKPEGQLGLAVDRVGMIAEAEDPVGVYTVELVIRDLVSNNEFRLFSSFKVNEANKSIN
jgi:hypothetical protein